MCFQYVFTIHNLAIVNSAATNMDVLVLLWNVILESFNYIW